MIDRGTFWYLFGFAAVTLLLLRLRSTRRADLRDPVVFSFTVGIFLSSFGTLSKQPLLARFIDGVLGTNAAWVVADSFFLIGMCGLTYWIDFMRAPQLAERGWSYLHSKRSALLAATIAWMVLTTWWQGSIWGTLERGGIDVGGQFLLLSSRVGYFAYSLWAITYLSLRFYQLRREMVERVNYIRLSLAWAAVMLAALSPTLQFLATIEIFFYPQYLELIWPGLWVTISAIQVIVAALVLSIFIEPAYRFITWLDKQRLIRRLLRAQGIISETRPDLIGRLTQPKPNSIMVKDPDPLLAILVNEMEIARFLLGSKTESITVPAGGVMPSEVQQILRQQKQRFSQALSGQPDSLLSTVQGDTYTLARWYAHFDFTVPTSKHN